MYKDGELTDEDVYCNLSALVTGEKPGRERADERIYFNAVGLSFVDVAIALAMFQRARDAGIGEELTLQGTTIFEQPGLEDLVRL